MKHKQRNGNIPLFFVLSVAILLSLIVVSLIAYAGLIYYYFAYKSTDPIDYVNIRPSQYATYIYDYTGNRIDKLHGEEKREYAALSEMPLNLRNAVIALEDRRFYEHPGIDPRGIARAVYVNLREQGFIEGASTITQQLVKNNLLMDSSVKLNRKIEEQCVAFKLEWELTTKLGSKQKAKEFILEQYLNSVNFAHGVKGVKLAARYYFGKNLQDLTLAECASIAAIIKNPVRYSPENSAENNWERAQIVIHKMLEQEMISYVQYEEANNEDIYTNRVGKADDDINSIHTYFVDQVINDVARDLMFVKGLDESSAYKLVYGGGLSIYTTFDPEIQRIVDEAFSDDSLFPKNNIGMNVNITFETEQGIVRKSKVAPDDYAANEYVAEQRQRLLNAGYSIESESVQKIIQPQAAFAIIDYKTGHVPAIGAGRGDKQYNLAFNRATQAKRQPGSCFKVLGAYLPALDTGAITKDTPIDDSPYTVDGYSPQNYDFRYRGNISLRTAIRDSINVAAVKTLVKVGYKASYEYLKKLGFTTIVESRTTEDGAIYTDLGPALALGGLTDGVTPLELAGAYGAIANGGMYNEPVFYTKVIAHDGTVLLENNVIPEQVIKPGTAHVLTDMMQDVVLWGTGTQARLRNINVSVAGKTGTSTDDKDLTFCGYTPFYVASVWQGYDIPKELKYGTNYHLLLWRRIMEQVHILKGYSSGSFY